MKSHHQENDMPVVAIIGAGLVGSLAGIYMRKLGYAVELYEKRADIRELNHVGEHRSINLALSTRGIKALKEVSLSDRVLENALPMMARMVHSEDGKVWSLKYGTHDEAIFSINRRELNELILNELSSMDSVSLFFQSELVSIQDETMELVIRNKATGQQVKRKVNFILGCDGAYSKVRQELLRLTPTDFSQEYIQHGYLEIQLPSEGALPNLDGSFTATLFYPYESLLSLKNQEDIVFFFKTHFPDFLEAAGTAAIIDAVKANPVGSMVTIRCSKYHFLDKILLLGDAAHAMVPFYGQGMNAGFEDVRILYEKMSKGAPILEVFNNFSRERCQDAYAICDLALYNYWEMSEGVQSWKFLVTNYAYSLIHRIFPRHIIPLYSMVAFSNIRYSQVMRRHVVQEFVLKILATTAGLSIATFFASKLMRIFRHH